MVLVERRRADAVQLTARQHWLEQVACVHGALGFARAHNGVQLIDEQDNPALALLDLVQHRLEAFLKFAAEFRAGNQRAHIQGEDFAVFEVVRHVPAHNTQCQAFRNSGFADAGFADQHRIVLRLAGQNTDDVSNLVVAADHRVELMVLCKFNQILAVFGERVIGFLRRVAGHAGVAAHAGQRGQEGVLLNAKALEDILHGVVGPVQNRKHDMLDGNILVLHPVGFFFRRSQDCIHVCGNIDFPRLTARAGHAWDAGNLFRHCALDGVAVYMHLFQQLRDQPVALLQQSRHEVFFLDLHIVVFNGEVLGFLDGFQGFLGEFLCIHVQPLLSFTHSVFMRV